MTSQEIIGAESGIISTNTAVAVAHLRASDIAYERLREMILDLRLAPGEVINELSLSSMIGIGRMPVREALLHLAGDRFVTALPRRGTVVSSLTMVDVVHLYEAREAVECGISRLVARRITDEQVEDFRVLVERAEEARDVFDAERFLLDDLRIHRFVIDLMDNALLHNAADTLLLHNLRFWRSFFHSRLPQSDTMLSHRDLLTAFEKRDADGAEAAARAHIEGARQLLSTLFDGN